MRSIAGRYFVASMPNIEKREITAELKESYLDYAMSVIVSRALPDVRDGLKPVQRRVLWAMWETGLRAGTKLRKSAAVVGEVMKSYHPHGDSSIYDALTRMVQKFSLRYPLIEGQGNWGCFTGDTKVTLTDGRFLSFRELVREYEQGKRNYTLTFNRKTKEIEIAEIKHPRVTRTNAELVRVILDSGEKLRCTPDHKFLLRNGTYRTAQNLRAGDSLMPSYFRLSTARDDPHAVGYHMIFQPIQAVWSWMHRLSDTFNLQHGVYPFSAGRVRHHKDINKLNNNPENIVRMGWKEHWQLHADLASWRHHNDLTYIEKLKNGREKYYADPAVKRNISKRYTAMNLKKWADPVYRARMVGAAKKRWATGVYDKEKLSVRASQNLITLWQSPAYAKKMSKLKSEEMKTRWLDPFYRAKASALWEKPGMRDFHREKLQAQRRDPQFIARIQNGRARMNKKRIETDPDFMRRLAQKSAVSLRKKWQDPAYKATVIRSRILGYAYSLLKQQGALTPELYEKGRPNHIPALTKAKEYFGTFEEIRDAAPWYNHRVLVVENLSEREDVYDLTIDGTHNFALAAGVFVHNSVDGDNQAAMRYTECRLSKISEELLIDMERETVDWLPNYDSSTQEPKVLPAKIPNLLLNGAVGIAVGMATSIPPHHLGEVVDAALHLIKNPKASALDLMQFIQGPDFPTGGIIYDKNAIAQAYTTGRGPITCRAVAAVEERKGTKGGFDIVVTEIPYQVNKSELIIKIAELVQEKRIEGIRDLRDESDKDGLRVVVELKNDATPQKVLNQLYNHTDLQKDFHLNMIALVDVRDERGAVKGLQPQVLSVKDVLEAYLAHRQDVVKRRAEFDLARARERAHILEGLAKALDSIDRIIETIKKSADRADAHKNLVAKFKFSEIQANAILEMRLQTLAALERQKIEDELKEKKKLIADLELLLRSPQKILKVIEDELSEVKAKYGDERRTKVVAGGLKDFKEEDLIADEDAVITLSASGYIKRLPPDSFRSQKRGGKGLIGSDVAEEDFLTHLITASTHDNILFFTERGRVFQTKVWEIPAAGRTAKGKPIQNFLDIPADEHGHALIAYRGDRKQVTGDREEGAPKFLVMLTNQGVIKKTTLTDFANVRRSGIIAIKLRKGDRLNWVKTSTGADEIIIATAHGKAIRFKETQARPMGRGASGVRAIRLKGGDTVSSLDIIPKGTKDAKLLVVGANGYGKQTPLGQYRLQGRGGSGIKTAQVTKKTGPIVSAHLVAGEEELLVLTAKGQVIKTRLSEVRVAGRATQGVKIMTLDSSDSVSSATCL